MKRLVLVLLGVALAGSGGYWLVPQAVLTSRGDGGYVDMHVHVGCIGTGGSGCYVSPQLRNSYKFGFYLDAFGVSEAELDAQGDALVIQRLSKSVAASGRVRKAVVLALDGVINEHGDIDYARTQVYVPNDFLIRELPAFENLAFGASVNPYRPDALARLDRVKKHGAVLVKWIPAIMDIDPSDRRIIPFYERLIALGLPLLTHTGRERSFADARDELGDPERLRLPLELGVTVIAAHIATTGEVDGEENFDRLLPMFAQYPNLYADISSLTQINKLGYLRRALAHEDIVARLVYGSDWPLQFFPLVSPWYQIGHVPLALLKAVQAIRNPWDRDVALKEAMGVPAPVFSRSARLLGL